MNIESFKEAKSLMEQIAQIKKDGENDAREQSSGYQELGMSAMDHYRPSFAQSMQDAAEAAFVKRQEIRAKAITQLEADFEELS